MKKSMILVPKVHGFNFPVFYILSFFRSVMTYEITPFINRIGLGRIERINLFGEFGTDQGQMLRADAVNILERTFDAHSRTDEWKVTVRGKTVDLYLKARQDIGGEMETTRFLTALGDKYADRYALVVDSFMSRLIPQKSREKRSVKTAGRLLSAVNVFLDKIYLWVINAGLMTRTLRHLASALYHNRFTGRKYRYIYDSDNPLELTLDKDRMTMTWIFDGENIPMEEVLYVSSTVNSSFEKKAVSSGLSFVCLPDMSRLASPKQIFSLWPDVLGAFWMMISSAWSARDILRAKYFIQIMRWVPIVEATSPEVYISTMGNIGIQPPVITYLRARGVKTVAWTYTCSCGRFYIDHKPEKKDFRNIRYANLLSDVNVVWNRNMVDFIGMHPNMDTKVKAIGPMIAAMDEGVMNLSKEDICARFKIPFRADGKYVSVFDVPFFLPGLKAISTDFTLPEYKRKFLEDVFALIDGCRDRDIVFLFKQKKPSDRDKDSYPAKVLKMIRELGAMKNVIMLDPLINLWAVIGLNDLCITLPFGSPAMASLHYGKPAIFHDALNIARYPRFGYDKIESLITRNFNNLKEKFENCLYGKLSFAERIDGAKISDVCGPVPGTNSSLKFREYLKGGL